MFSSAFPTVRILILSLVSFLLLYVLSNHATGLFNPPLNFTNNCFVAAVLMIGASHAGLSTALLLIRHKIEFLIFDSGYEEQD